MASPIHLRLVERVMLDALAQHVDPDDAPELLRRSLIGTPVPPACDVEEIADYLHDHLSRTLRRELGAAASDEVMCTADALLAPLRHDALLANRPAFRAPYVLVSDVVHSLEGVIEMQRVTTLVDALLECDARPEATLVIDLGHSAISLTSLALMSNELPQRTQILVVGASDVERADFESVTLRAATFMNVYLPLDLRTPAPPLARAA